MSDNMNTNMNTNRKHIVIIADHQDKSWDDFVRNDVTKNRLPMETLLSMELRRENKFLDAIDLFNYSCDKRSLHQPEMCAISRQDRVTLNGIFLSDYLMKHGYEVSLVKNFVTQKSDLVALLKEKPFAIVISTTFFPLEVVKDTVSYIEEFLTGGTRIIVGGPAIYYAANFYPEILKMYALISKNAFFIVEKQGERSLIRLLARMAVDDGDLDVSLEGLNNVIKSDKNGNLMVSSLQEEKNDINDHLIDWKNLPDRFLSRVIPVRTSIGCPYRCGFCTFWMLHPKPLFKTFANITNELKAINNREGVKHIMITDDTLNISGDRIKSFCNLIIQNKLSLEWSAFLRSKPMNREIAGLLAESNCKFVHIGFESFEDTVLENMNKKETAEDHIRCIEHLKKAGIGVLGSLIFGYPGETGASALNTVSSVNQTGVDITEIYGFIYYPYSPVSEKKEEFQLTGEVYNWRHYTMDSRELYHSILPKAVAGLKNYGVLGYDNWGTAALLSSHGFGMAEIRDLFKIKHNLIKMQNSTDESKVAGELRKMPKMEMRSAVDRE